MTIASAKSPAPSAPAAARSTAAAGAVDVEDLPFELAVPDAAFPPSLLATTAYRLRAVDTGRFDGPASAREPLLELIDSLHIGPSRFVVTTRVGVRGDRDQPIVEADLLITALGGAEVRAELAAVQRHLDERFFGTDRMFAAERLPIDALDLPTSGEGYFIRQSTVSIGPDDIGGEAHLPVRFAYPGPSALPRLLGALLAAGPGTDLYVTVSPTELRAGEREELEHARGVAGSGGDLAQIREAATALDAVLSYRTEVSVVQVLLVTGTPMAEVTRRAIATALTASFDTQHHHGHRVVASPQRFVGGGFSVEPCRDLEDVLTRLRYGLPRIGFPERDTADLITATELAYCLGWPADEAGALPGIAESTREAPPFDTGSGWPIGRDPLGRTAGIAEQDRCLHTVFIGGSGSGKTTLLTGAIDHDFDRGNAVIAIDPHGDLLLRALSAVPRARQDRVFLLDCSTGLGDRLNLLRLSESPARRRVHAAAVVEGTVTDLNPDFAGPVFHEVIPPLLAVLGDRGATLRDLHTYLHDPDRLERDAREVGRDDAVALATDMRRWSPSHRGEVATWARAKFHWVDVDEIATSVCSTQPTFDLADALAPGGVLLVHPGDDPTAGALLSSVLLSIFLSSFTGRGLHSPPVSIYLDEVQRFSGNMVRRAMNEARKRAVALHLATQNLTNVSGEFEAILGNAGHLVLGRSVGPTAGFAEHELGIPVSTMSRLPNLRAMCRLSPGGQPCEPFALDIEPPSGLYPTERPQWLDARVEERWAGRR